ncbi:Replication-associated, partial [Olea europaea subsp. europaea]
SAHFHPNIRRARSSSDVNNYISKYGDFIEDGSFQIDKRSARGCPSAVAEHNIFANLDKEFPTLVQRYISPYNPNSFIIPNELRQWSIENIIEDAAARPHRPKSIFIESHSYLGKTIWARSLGHHNYIKGHIDLSSKTFNNNAVYNVIDDVPPSYLKIKHWNDFIGAQKDWQSNMKYEKSVQIKGRIPSVVLCNPAPDSYKSFLDKEENVSLKNWTIANAEFIDITSPLFSEIQTQNIQEEQSNST